MINQTYNKYCDTARLTSELVIGGFPMHPNTGARFYGVRADWVGAEWITTVMLYDDISQGEIASIDAIVTAHIPTPLPTVEPAIDEEGKMFVRAESRPLDCTTVFTNRGDSATVIGAGKTIYWDFSNSDDIVTPPTGFKRKRIVFQFLDPVYIKDGALYFFNTLKGSYVDVWLVCPTGGYYQKNDGSVAQASVDTPIAHFLINQFMQGDCPMSDEFNSETRSLAIPTYMQFWAEITVPDTDSTSNGYMCLELFRLRTVVLE